MLAAVALVGCKRAEPVRVAAAGDVQLGAALTASPFAGGLVDGDVRLVNLEGPLTARGSANRDDEERFRFDPARAAWLRGRIDVVSLANNHALDQGVGGRDDTVRALGDIAAAYDGHDAVVARRGRRVTVIARYLAPDADLDAATPALVAAVKRAARPTIVSLHWGHTGSLLPDEAQKRLGRALVDAGAVAVVGHGPHTMQGAERWHRGVIAYSLGNFAFGCECTDVSDAYVLHFTVDGDAARDVVLTPIAAGLQRAPERSRDPGLHAQLDDLCRDLSGGVTVE